MRRLIGSNKRRIKQYVGKAKVGEKQGDTKDGDMNQYNVQFAMKESNT